MTHEEALAAARTMECRIPYESEWEYACRAMTQTLFVWGDELPPYEEQCQWMVADFSKDMVTSRDYIRHFSKEFRLRCSAFGLYALFVGEWCMDAVTAGSGLGTISPAGGWIPMG